MVGCGGVGKTTLINELVKDPEISSQTKRISEVARTILKERGITGPEMTSDKDLFWEFQLLIIQEQLKRESLIQASEDLISDRCSLDAIVYGILFFSEKFDPVVINSITMQNFDPNSTKNSDMMRQILTPFCRNSDLTLDQIQSAVRRYQNALVVLVYPWGWTDDEENALEDDGTRKTMTCSEVMKFTRVYENVLALLEIPFETLRETKLWNRVKLVAQLLRCHKGVQNKVIVQMQ